MFNPMGYIDLLGQLQGAAAGRGPSAAERLVRASNSNQAAQTQGQAMSLRGPQTQGLALRNAQRINMQRQAQTNTQLGALRAQEQQGARAMAAPLLQNQAAAQMAGISGGIDTVNQARGSAFGWLGGAASAGLPLLLSDARRKRDLQQALASGDENRIREARKAMRSRGASEDEVNTVMREFLQSLNPSTFNYDNEAQGAERRVGVTAQDVARSRAGSQMVVNTPQGAALDPTSATGPILAALGDLNRRLETVERPGEQDPSLVQQRPPRSTPEQRRERQRERLGADASMNQAELDEADRQMSALEARQHPNGRPRQRYEQTIDPNTGRGVEARVEMDAQGRDTFRELPPLVPSIERQRAAEELERNRAAAVAARQATQRLRASNPRGRMVDAITGSGLAAGFVERGRQNDVRRSAPNPRGRTSNSFRSAPRRY